MSKQSRQITVFSEHPAATFENTVLRLRELRNIALIQKPAFTFAATPGRGGALVGVGQHRSFAAPTKILPLRSFDIDSAVYKRRGIRLVFGCSGA